MTLLTAFIAFFIMCACIGVAWWWMLLAPGLALCALAIGALAFMDFTVRRW